MTDIFCCPVCNGQLHRSQIDFLCQICERNYPVIDGIPDFYTAESDHNFSDDPNTIWLDPAIVEARDTVYRLCARELKGMTFCMAEIGKRTKHGCRVLEVGTGTGHFTRWMAEVSAPGTQIYSFDFSWPILETARVNIGDAPVTTLFRANAREGLPFQVEAFDIVFIRLAPLGPHGVSNVEASFDLLKSGGWYFGAGWEEERFETSPTAHAFQHGYVYAEHHAWKYKRWQSEEENTAWQIELGQLLSQLDKSKKDDLLEKMQPDQCSDRGYLKTTQEHVLMAQKPE